MEESQSLKEEPMEESQSLLLQTCKKILQDEDENVESSLKCKVCLALSNIIADKNQFVLPMILDSGIHRDALLPILLSEKNFEQYAEDRELQLEIAYCYSNAFLSTKNFDVVRSLVFDHYFMMALVRLLDRAV